jgi:4-amino-4-deoxy-L-arabinose transferase-like glycosyltransferase
MLSFPDAPFIFFWMLTMWALWRASRETAWGWWALVGTGVGLAALSKLAALFLGIAVAGYLLWGERGRRWWRRPEIYGAAVLALALMVPMLQWNAAHGGIMVAKARNPYAWVSTGIPALNALAYAGAHLFYYGPLAAVLLLLALAGAWRGPRATDPRNVLVLWMAVPILVVFGAMSFDGTAKPHWTAPAYLTMLLPAAALWATLRSVRLWRALVTAAVAVNLVLVGGLATVGFWPGSPAAQEQRAWPEFAVELQRLVEATPVSPGRFILVPDYQTAAQIEYHLGGTLVTTPFGFDAYEVWISRQRLIDWNAIYLTADDPAPGIPIERMFRRVEQLPPLSFALRGQIFRTYTVYRGLGYRGFPRPVARPL